MLNKELIIPLIVAGTCKMRKNNLLLAANISGASAC